MAQKIQIVLTDDIDGSEATETVAFALDGTTYEIDLSAPNAGKLRDAIAPYVGHARKVSGRGKAVRKVAGGTNAAEVRAWAKSNGFTVPDRGRIPAEVRSAYDAAN